MNDEIILDFLKAHGIDLPVISAVLINHRINLLELLKEFRNGHFQAIYGLISSLEQSDAYDNGVPMSDLFESFVMQDFGVMIEDVDELPDLDPDIKTEIKDDSI